MVVTPVTSPCSASKTGKEPGLCGQAGDPHGIARVAHPSEGAWHQDVDVAGAADRHGPGHLRLEVVQVRHGGGGHIGNAMCHGQDWHVLALSERVPGWGPTASVVAVRAAGGVAPDRWTPVFM